TQAPEPSLGETPPAWVELWPLVVEADEISRWLPPYGGFAPSTEVGLPGSPSASNAARCPGCWSSPVCENPQKRSIGVIGVLSSQAWLLSSGPESDTTRATSRWMPITADVLALCEMPLITI